MTTTTTTLPALSAGTWSIDPAHSEVSFSVRHLMVSKVRGRFTSFEGSLHVADDPLASTVETTVDVASVDTHDERRDNHLRSPEFFDVERFPTMAFRSTGISAGKNADHYRVEGALTIHGTTRPVTLALEFNGVQVDPWGSTRAGFSASTEISRRQFGIDIAMPLDGGGVVVGDAIKIDLEVEAVLEEKTAA